MGFYVDRDGDTIWLADSEGWGWFLAGILIILPFFILFTVMNSIAVWITENFWTANMISLAVNVLLSLILSLHRKIKTDFYLQIIANLLLFQTVFFTLLLYGIPYLIQSGSIWESVELILTTAVNIGAVILVKAIGKLHGNVKAELITSILFLCIYCFLMNHAMQGFITLEAMLKLYHLEKTWAASLFFGIFFL